MNRGIGKDVFLMSFGTIIAQLINVLIQPILTRLVDPSVLGILRITNTGLEVLLKD